MGLGAGVAACTTSRTMGTARLCIMCCSISARTTISEPHASRRSRPASMNRKWLWCGEIYGRCRGDIGEVWGGVQGHLRRDGEVVLRLERAAVEPDLEAEIDELAHLRLVAVEGVHHAAAWGWG